MYQRCAFSFLLFYLGYHTKTRYFAPQTNWLLVILLLPTHSVDESVRPPNSIPKNMMSSCIINLFDTGVRSRTDQVLYTNTQATFPFQASCWYSSSTGWKGVLILVRLADVQYRNLIFAYYGKLINSLWDSRAYRLVTPWRMLLVLLVQSMPSMCLSYIYIGSDMFSTLPLRLRRRAGWISWAISYKRRIQQRCPYTLLLWSSPSSYWRRCLWFCTTRRHNFNMLVVCVDSSIVALRQVTACRTGKIQKYSYYSSIRYIFNCVLHSYPTSSIIVS